MGATVAAQIGDTGTCHDMGAKEPSQPLEWCRVRIATSPAAGAGPGLAHLEAAPGVARGTDLLAGAVGATSNVTGILTDSEAVTRTLKAHGPLAVRDRGAAAPYVPVRLMTGSDAEKDAIVLSAHKPPGSPGASGVMIRRDAMGRRTAPARPGGGTVSLDPPRRHDHPDRLVHREDGGTAN
ncbi:MAG: aminotransferase class V-fold PLP-dependent enzyme [Defluviimonas sp.]|uniref:aminotransferase class V-fold PLP-dependent enzyme n=1 Tax=Albidovulum sp. TaxID=1872424 RepID=UPI002A339A7C|nr:aminotransferase class V-fold PLP-dependent enzyme [Defluviimonas sp.]